MVRYLDAILVTKLELVVRVSGNLGYFLIVILMSTWMSTLQTWM